MFNEVDKLILKNGVICPTCCIKGLKDFGYTTTIAASNNFEDENGNYHEHDGNSADGRCECQNGHQFSIRLFNSCWCGWTQSLNQPFGQKTVSDHQNPAHEILGIHTSLTEDNNGKLITNIQTFYRNY